MGPNKSNVKKNNIHTYLKDFLSHNSLFSVLFFIDYLRDMDNLVIMMNDDLIKAGIVK